MDYPELADFLLAAEAVLDIPTEKLKYVADLGLAESALAAPQASFGGEVFYPDPRRQAAVLCSRIVRNHPLPDGNKRVALVLMLDFIERNGLTWTEPTGGQDEIAEMIENLAARRLSEGEFAIWVASHVK